MELTPLEIPQAIAGLRLLIKNHPDRRNPTQGDNRCLWRDPMQSGRGCLVSELLMMFGRDTSVCDGGMTAESRVHPEWSLPVSTKDFLQRVQIVADGDGVDPRMWRDVDVDHVDAYFRAA